MFLCKFFIVSQLTSQIADDGVYIMLGISKLRSDILIIVTASCVIHTIDIDYLNIYLTLERNIAFYTAY